MLNFEHVPPRSAFNKNTRYKEIPYLDYMKNNPLDVKLKGRVGQGGIGFYSFCENCNNFLGTEYVRSYKSWAEIGAYILQQGDYFSYEYDAFQQKPNKIIKQIISMFVAINKVWFIEEYPELIEFIRNPLSTTLNERFRFFTYLNDVGTQYRHLPFTISENLGSGEITKCCEIAFPPFGYVMTIDSNSDIKYLAEITQFKNYDPNNEAKLSLRLARLETNLPIPLDYRSKKEIQDTIDKSKKDYIK